MILVVAGSSVIALLQVFYRVKEFFLNRLISGEDMYKKICIMFHFYSACQHSLLCRASAVLSIVNPSVCPSVRPQEAWTPNKRGV